MHALADAFALPFFRTALIISLVSVALITGATALWGAISTTFNSISGWLSIASP